MKDTVMELRLVHSPHYCGAGEMKGPGRLEWATISDVMKKSSMGEQISAMLSMAMWPLWKFTKPCLMSQCCHRNETNIEVLQKRLTHNFTGGYVESSTSVDWWLLSLLLRWQWSSTHYSTQGQNSQRNHAQLD